MASASCKENSNCRLSARQDISQEQTKTREPQVFAQKFVFGNVMKFVFGDIMRCFQPKEAEALEGRNSVRFCKSDNAGTNGVVLWIDTLRKNVSRSLSYGGFSRQRSSDRGLESDTASIEEVSLKRSFCFEGKPKRLSSLENHLLLFMFNHSHDVKGLSIHDQDEGTLHCRWGHSAEAIKAFEGSETTMGVFLQAHPVENSNLAQGLTAGMTKASLWKQCTLGFARLQGEPQITYSECSHREQQPKSDEAVQSEESQRGSPLRFLAMDLTSFLHLIPGQQLQAFPDKEKLSSVQDFFLYVETEGKSVFQDLDRDKDGKLTLEDIRVAMHKMKIPSSNAKKFMHSKHRHWAENTLGWTEFSLLMQEKEPIMIRLFNSLGVSKHGTLERTHVKNLLRKSSLPMTESNVTAMMKALGGEGGSIKYGQFRRFMLLIPTEQLRLDPWSVWFKAATTGAESEESRGSILNHVTSLSRGFLQQLEVAKAKVIAPSFQRVDVPDFLKSRAKHTIHDPLTRAGADVLEISG